MFSVIGSFFRTLNELFLGTEKYAKAFNKTGDLTLAKVDVWIKEEEEKLLAPITIDAVEEPKRIKAA